MLGLFIGYWLGSPPGYLGGIPDGGGDVTYVGNALGGSTGYVGGWLGISFPTQYEGLRIYVPSDDTAGYLGGYLGGSDAYFGGSRINEVVDLCLVLEADAPNGMGGVLKMHKGGFTNYAVYLVETTDPNASAVRIRTTTGVKAIRLKT